MASRGASPSSTSSTLSCITVQTGKHSNSRSSMSASPPTSTPPTSQGDEASIVSDATKMEPLVEAKEEPSTPQPQTKEHAAAEQTPEAPKSEGTRRSARSSRASVTTYNVQILAGTAIHTPTKYLEQHHKNVLHKPSESDLVDGAGHNSDKVHKNGLSKPDSEDTDDPVEEQLATETAQAAQRRRSSRQVDLRKEAARNLVAAGEAVAQKGQALFNTGKQTVQHILRSTATDSRAKESDKSVTGTTLKRACPSTAPTPDEDEEEVEPGKVVVKSKTKKWLQQGLYVGQHRDFEARLSETQNRMRRKSKQVHENKTLPLPMFAGERLLKTDPRKEWRDFKLPFDTYSPLNRKVKVDGWQKLQKNRFVGEASALWKRDKQDASSCSCSPEDGCGESCHNRVMSYECDSSNCKLTSEHCGNRPFAELRKRAKGNRYDYGVEVMETEDRGYGVRAMRTFEPHQIIVEYAGEIITQAECERRMRFEYKKNKCYYLMSFDNKMIIDATRGTIARFVNHSCEPNCEMNKLVVGGEPRMALFAGPRGIMTGEELTYDYNFDPFSSKNIQECRCGTESCRGVLGPKPKDWKKLTASAIIAGTKRKIQEVLGSSRGSVSAPNSPQKKRKIATIANSELTKTKKVLAETAATREKAEKDAAEHAAQIASREARASRRSTISKKSQILRRRTRTSLPVPLLKSKKQSPVSVKTHRSVPKPGALKPINRASRLASRVMKRNVRVLKGKNRSLPPARTPRTPANPPLDSSSPNITSSSLRSASGASKLKQTKLQFRPLGRDIISDPLDSPMTSDDDEDDSTMREFAAPPSRRGNKRPTTANSVKKTINRSVRGTKRMVGVAKAGAGLGFKGMGGLNEGGSGSTIRMITGADD
ncbi:hypothetical protein K469DRAFT_654052 [Zopfia rhizophila CBS 207.26]|uniref:SET domain-containing protein n=1 Tax=Zopfia rhizophila CBS 207.26 TaxID=1314779 RepID=A0A6A6ENZ8_9PEZI|nr:hypothetical protein K469DRAFT_654052 [Zopfia rhizophila CBS 207.26]